MMTDLEVERQNLNAKLQNLLKDDKEFSKNILTIFEIASKAHDIFKSSELDEPQVGVSQKRRNYQYFVSELGNEC
jgi:hypothetical protein